MALQKITLIISKRSAVKVKNILYKLNAKIPKINIAKRLSDDEIEIEFKVPFESSENIIEKFINDGLEVKPTDVNIKRILFRHSNKIKDSSASQDLVNSDNFNRSNNELNKPKDVSKFVNNYLKTNKKILSKDKDLLKNSINSYISQLKEEAYISDLKADENISSLIEIASSKKLKNSLSLEVIKNAGLVAITISSERVEHTGELINICNNRNLHRLVNAKAAAKFAEIVSQDEKLYKTDILIALKRLNSRWLLTVADAAENDLSDDEKFNFNKLKSFVKKKSF